MRLALAAALVALLLAAAPTHAAERFGRCAVPERATVGAVGGRLVVWSVEFADRWGDVIRRVTACRRTSGARVRVIEGFQDEQYSDEFTGFAVAGRYVALVDFSHGRNAAHATAVVVFDAYRARTVRREVAGFNPPFGDSGFTTVPALALARSGAVAYVVRHAEDRDHGGHPRERVGLRALDAAGRRLLDKGDGIDPASLRLDGAVVSWTNAGEPRSATLR